MKLNPTHDNILVRRDKAEEKKTPSGIVLPEDGQKNPDTAVVVAVGEGRRLANGDVIVPGVKAGDRVLLGRFSGTEVNWEMERLTVIGWGDVLGIVLDKSSPAKKTGHAKKNTRKGVDKA